MVIDGYYYLHENGEVIWKRYLGPDQEEDFMDSDLVKYFWPIDLSDRASAWHMLVEATALGANQSKIETLARGWRCTNSDACIYCERMGLELCQVENEWNVSLVEDACMHASGSSPLKALANLCWMLGFRGGKTLTYGFRELIGYEHEKK